MSDRQSVRGGQPRQEVRQRRPFGFGLVASLILHATLFGVVVFVTARARDHVTLPRPDAGSSWLIEPVDLVGGSQVASGTAGRRADAYPHRLVPLPRTPTVDPEATVAATPLPPATGAGRSGEVIARHADDPPKGRPQTIGRGEESSGRRDRTVNVPAPVSTVAGGPTATPGAADPTAPVSLQSVPGATSSVDVALATTTSSNPPRDPTVVPPAVALNPSERAPDDLPAGRATPAPPSPPRSTDPPAVSEPVPVPTPTEPPMPRAGRPESGPVPIVTERSVAERPTPPSPIQPSEPRTADGSRAAGTPPTVSRGSRPRGLADADTVDSRDAAATASVPKASAVVLVSPRDGDRIDPDAPPVVFVEGRVADPHVTTVAVFANERRMTARVSGGSFKLAVPIVDEIVRVRAEIPGAESATSRTVVVHAAGSRPGSALLALDWPDSGAELRAELVAAWRSEPGRLDVPARPTSLRELGPDADGRLPRLLYLRNVRPGAYTFLLSYRGAGTPQSTRATLYLPAGGRLREHSLTPVTLNGAGQVVLARVLLPYGVFWEQDDWFSGQSESSDSVTKFRFPEGLSWTERRVDR